jgi:F-type H+-transporting ATPase subunit c
MDPTAAKFLAAGLACVGMGLAGVGIAILFATTHPGDKVKSLGLLLTGGFGVASLLIALLVLFAL